MNPFAFYNDGLRVKPAEPRGNLTDTGIRMDGVSPKAIVEDEAGFKWMLKFEGAEYDIASTNMAFALRLPQPWVGAWNGKYISRGYTERGIGSVQEWLDGAEKLRNFQSLDANVSNRIHVQKSLHTILDYLASDGDRHDGNYVVWYNDLYAIDRSRSLGWGGAFAWGKFYTSSKVMNLVGPDEYEKYIDRLDRISDNEWCDMAGGAGTAYKNSLLNRKHNLRQVIVNEAERHVARVNGEKRDEWDRFIRLNKGE